MQQKLFDDNEQLFLPQDLLDYTPAFLPVDDATGLYDFLRANVPWQQQKQKLYEKEVVTPRLSIWYGYKRKKDSIAEEPAPLLPELLPLKKCIEEHTGITFNGVLLNYYRDQQDSVAWHSDKDTIPGLKTEIASISLGQERDFDFRNKNDHKQRYSLLLEHGSLLLMKGDLQRFWEHRIAKSPKQMMGRINLTFRKVAD